MLQQMQSVSKNYTRYQKVQFLAKYRRSINESSSKNSEKPEAQWSEANEQFTGGRIITTDAKRRERLTEPLHKLFCP